MQKPNKSRGRVETFGFKFGNDQILDMGNFAEMDKLLRQMKRRLALLPFCVGLILLNLAAHSLAGPVSLEPDEVQQLRKLINTNASAAAQFSNLLEVADSALGDKPNPIEFVVSEGHLNKDPLKRHSAAAMQDMLKISCLGWAWAGSGDQRYLTKAHDYILAWAKVNKPDGDAINETQFEPLIVAYDSIRGNFSQDEQLIVDNWLRSKANTLLVKGTNFGGNWPCHRLKIVGLIGMALNDKPLIASGLDGFRKQVAKDIRPDGSCSDFYVRDSMHYQLYSVEPLLPLARASERYGVNLFDYKSPGGASLHKAVDFVVPFADGEKSQIEFLNSKSSFDRQRADNGEKEYQPHPWKPKASIQMFSLAGWFDPKYQKLAAKIAHRADDSYFDWQIVINDVSRHGQIGK